MMTDMENDGMPRGARALLLELQGDGKDRVADLILTAMIEKCADISDLEVGMHDAAMNRLMTLPSFREAMERGIAERLAEREAKAAERLAEREALVEAKTRVADLRDVLLTYFTSRGDTPSDDELATLDACGNPTILRSWLQRAYNGETAAQILKKR